jgi:hypothetical protein
MANPGGKTTPPPGKKHTANLPVPAEDGTLMAALRERRDRAMARRITVQNRVTRGELVPRDTVKMVLGRLGGAWRSILPESSHSTAPVILASLNKKDPAADSRLRLLIDDEVYGTAGIVNRAMEAWLQTQEESAGDE